MAKKTKPTKKKPLAKIAAKKSKSTVFWAVDPFAQNREATLVAAKAISHFNKGDDMEVLPRHVLDFVISHTSKSVKSQLEKSFRSEFLPKAEVELRSIVQSCELPQVGEPIVISRPTQSLRESVNELLKAAAKEKAGLIALSTHARKGLSRLFLGSFAETLATASKIPLLTVSPDAKIGEIKTILVPTDFSKESAATFDVIVNKAKKLGAKIILFHKELSAIAPVAHAGLYMLGGGWFPAAQYLEQDQKAKEDLANKWMSKARAKGVDSEYVTNSPDLGISSAIVDTAKVKNADLIAITNQVGPWKAVLLGSVTKDVLRDATVPVWVLHSK